MTYTPTPNITPNRSPRVRTKRSMPVFWRRSHLANRCSGVPNEILNFMSNDQRERREAAAAGVQFETERNCCPPMVTDVRGNAMQVQQTCQVLHRSAPLGQPALRRRFVSKLRLAGIDPE